MALSLYINKIKQNLFDITISILGILRRQVVVECGTHNTYEGLYESFYFIKLLKFIVFKSLLYVFVIEIKQSLNRLWNDVFIFCGFITKNFIVGISVWSTYGKNRKVRKFSIGKVCQKPLISHITSTSYGLNVSFQECRFGP